MSSHFHTLRPFIPPLAFLAVFGLVIQIGNTYFESQNQFAAVTTTISPQKISVSSATNKVARMSHIFGVKLDKPMLDMKSLLCSALTSEIKFGDSQKGKEDKKTRVHAIQLFLSHEGFSIDANELQSSVYGQSTRQAALSFQSMHNIKATGSLDSATKNSLWRGLYCTGAHFKK